MLHSRPVSGCGWWWFWWAGGTIWVETNSRRIASDRKSRGRIEGAGEVCVRRRSEDGVVVVEEGVGEKEGALEWWCKVKRGESERKRKRKRSINLGMEVGKSGRRWSGGGLGSFGVSGRREKRESWSGRMEYWEAMAMGPGAGMCAFWVEVPGQKGIAKSRSTSLLREYSQVKRLLGDLRRGGERGERSEETFHSKERVPSA